MAFSATWRLLTFPAVRRQLNALLACRGIGEALLFVGLFVATFPYVGLRAIADNWRAPIDGSVAENSLFHRLPTLLLQDHLHDGRFGFIEHAAVYVHMSWFFVPAAITAFVILRHRSEFTSYAAWYLLTMYLAAVMFFLVPLQPPWMADPAVSRILSLNWDEVRVDNNPVAAFPSLHVALPFALALWAFSREHRALGLLLVAFSTATALNVVYLGEHYVIDVLGAAGLACVVAALDVYWRRASAITAELAAPRRLVTRRSEAGQNLIEFALMFPMLLLFIGIIIVFGLMLHTRSNLQQAVREGARQAAVGKSLTDVQNLAAGNSNSTLDPGDIKWCFPAGTGSVGDPVMVYVYHSGGEGYPYDLVPSGGTFNTVFGAGALTVRMSPRATSRLEKSVPASIVSAAGACPS